MALLTYRSTDRIPMRRLCLALALSAGVALSWGCSESRTGTFDRRKTGGATPQTYRNVTMDATLDAAATVLREHFGLVRVSAGSGVVSAGPRSYTQRGGTQRASDATLRPTYQMRRSGTIWLTQEDGAILANCQVRVQRLDTTDYRSLQTHNEFNDLPTDTPIDSDAGLTAEQREVWTELPRDSKLERQILGAVHRRLHGLSDGDAPQATTP